MMVNGEERGNGVVCGDVACCGSGFGPCAVHPQKGVEIKCKEKTLNTEEFLLLFLYKDMRLFIRDPMVCRNM